jgi:hypothetical protein
LSCSCSDIEETPSPLFFFKTEKCEQNIRREFGYLRQKLTNFCCGGRKISNLLKISCVFVGHFYTPNRRRVYKYIGLCKNSVSCFRFMFVWFWNIKLMQTVSGLFCNAVVIKQYFRRVLKALSNGTAVRLSTWTAIGRIIVKLCAGFYYENLLTPSSFNMAQK